MSVYSLVRSFLPFYITYKDDWEHKSYCMNHRRKKGYHTRNERKLIFPFIATKVYQIVFLTKMNKIDGWIVGRGKRRDSDLRRAREWKRKRNSWNSTKNIMKGFYLIEWIASITHRRCEKRWKKIWRNFIRQLKNSNLAEKGRSHRNVFFFDFEDEYTNHCQHFIPLVKRSCCCVSECEDSGTEGDVVEKCWELNVTKTRETNFSTFQ